MELPIPTSVAAVLKASRMALSHDEAVSAQFSPRAGAYVTSPVHAAGEDLDLLEQVLEIRRPARVLDLGTGGGHVAFRAAPFATQVVAYDLSDAMLEQVAAEATRRGHANIATRQGFAESLPFEDASFDAVLTRFSAHHWHDVPRALAEARRVLGPGGIAVFIDVVAPESPLADTWLQSLELMRDPSHVRDYRRSEWLATLAEAGFAATISRDFRLRMEFSSWVARIGTPEPLVAGLRCLQAQAPAEVASHFGLEQDGSFTVESALIEAE